MDRLWQQVCDVWREAAYENGKCDKNDHRSFKVVHAAQSISS